jgi:hypothetical protein
VTSDEPLVEEWLKCDVFEKAKITQYLAQNPNKLPRHFVALSEQYRMLEPICGVVNELFYQDHPLRTKTAIGGEGPEFLLGNSPLLYVDTASFHPWAALRTGTWSRYNLFHALLLRNIVLHLAEMGVMPSAEKPNDIVGVVTPYAAQARLVQALIEDRLGKRAAGICATVHRFQGNEKRGIILDLTDSTGIKPSRFLTASKFEEIGARLLNVAISRARNQVILVGNFTYLRSKVPRESILQRLLDHFEQEGEALDPHGLLPIADLDWIDGLNQIIPHTFDMPEGAAGAFTEGTFYPAFSADIRRAENSIVIFSPFATGSGTARWVDTLRAAVNRGAHVHIVTLPPEEFGGGNAAEVAELIRDLRSIGVTVDLRRNMHEKIAMIDGRILWHGSLNILSHNKTSESMLRIESPSACEQLSRNVSLRAGRWEDGAPAFEFEGNPRCPRCDGPTMWNEGRNGIWFTCEDPECDGKVEARARWSSQEGRRTGSARRGGRRSAQAKSCPTPGCGGMLREREGRYGKFLGCSNYPKCRYTEKLE